MGAATTHPAAEPALTRFAARLRDSIGASRVLLFGLRACGDARPGSDYDVIIVAPAFAAVEPLHRGIGLRQLWRQAGGTGPMDLFCLTPDEFAQEQQHISLVAAVLPEAVDLLTPVEAQAS